MSYRAIGAVMLLALAGCKPEGPASLALQARQVVAASGQADERAVEIWEDARITPALRASMWGASKEPSALAASIKDRPLERGVVRLVDRKGTVLGEHRLDCELGAVAPIRRARGWSAAGG